MTASLLPPPPGPANPFLRFLDRLFLWIPNSRSPGFLAVCLFLIRQATLPLILLLAAGMALFLSFPKFNLLNGSRILPAWVIVFSINLCIDSIQELGRYSFARFAAKPARSLSVFTAVTIALVGIEFHDSPYTLMMTIAAQVAASLAMFYAVRFGKYIVPIIFLIILAHSSLYIATPQLSRLSHGKTASKDHQPVSTAPNPPSVGAMNTWAKLYPGARISESKSDTMLGLTSWNVIYTVKASPDQIEHFYESTAKEQHFNDSISLGGLHKYRQDSTHNDFSFSVGGGATGSTVIFEARAFATRPPS